MKQQWTVSHDRALFEMAAKGFTWARIGQELGRSKDSCSSYYRDAVRRRGKPVVRKPIRVRAARPTAEATASGNLLAAMTEAFARFANSANITVDEARVILLGGKPPAPLPGTETYLKTSAVRRLAA